MIGAAGATFNFATGLFHWAGGTFSGPGTLTNTGDIQVLDLPSGSISSKEIVDGGTLLNTGTMTWNFGTGFDLDPIPPAN